jgi:hypothetical protein
MPWYYMFLFKDSDIQSAIQRDIARSEDRERAFTEYQYIAKYAQRTKFITVLQKGS